MSFDQVKTSRLRQVYDEYCEKIINGLWVFDSERGEAIRIPEPEGLRGFFRLISDELKRREAA
jgi:hypothetical protein